MSVTTEGYIVTTFVALFAVMGVLTLPPVFLAVTTGMDHGARRLVALQTTIAIAVTMLVAFFLGEWILQLFNIDIDAFKVAGALVVANMAWGMISGRPSALLDSHGQSPAVIPLAIPKTAGPGAIAVAIAMGTAGSGGKTASDVLSIVGVTLLALAFMLAAGPIERLLGTSGLNILARIFGLLLLAIAITSILGALIAYFPGWAGAR